MELSVVGVLPAAGAVGNDEAKGGGKGDGTDEAKGGGKGDGKGDRASLVERAAARTARAARPTARATARA